MRDFSYLERHQWIIWSIIMLFVIALTAIGFSTVRSNKIVRSTTLEAPLPAFGLSPGVGNGLGGNASGTLDITATTSTSTGTATVSSP